MRFGKQDFGLVAEGNKAEALFKMAVYNEIQMLDSEALKKAMSIKHQVLCDQTAMIGVIKQMKKCTGELQETNVDFVRAQSSV